MLTTTKLLRTIQTLLKIKPFHSMLKTMMILMKICQKNNFQVLIVTIIYLEEKTLKVPLMTILLTHPVMKEIVVMSCQDQQRTLMSLE